MNANLDSRFAFSFLTAFCDTLIMVMLILIVAFNSFADAHPAKKSCFDFNQKITQAIEPLPTEFKEGDDPKDFGRTPNKEGITRYDFARISGVVKKPIEKIYEKLLDPRTIRDKDNTTVTLKEIPAPDFLKRTTQKIVIKAALFFTLEWDENWAYSLLKGTKEKPESILISYEKFDGTMHVRHLCGNILIQKLDSGKSGVYLYEEIDADRRDAKDSLNNIQGTLATLRKM